MGFDLRSFPVRLGSEPVRRIREYADLWEVATLHAPLGHKRKEPLPEISTALLAEVPDVQEWIWHYPDRSHDQAEYLLDPRTSRELRSYAERERSLPYRVIFGDEEFAEHARGPQGPRWRCSGAAFLRQAAALIDAIDPVSARRDFSVAEMERLHLYKVPNPAVTDDDEHFERILQHLRDIAAYYSQVAGRGLDLIIELN